MPLVKHNQNTKEMGLFKRTKNNNKPLIRQILDLTPKLDITKLYKQI